MSPLFASTFYVIILLEKEPLQFELGSPMRNFIFYDALMFQNRKPKP